MSVQSAKDFLKKLDAEPDLLAQFKNAPNPDTRHKMAKDAGFEFTSDEFKQAADEMAATAGQELTQEQLQAVAGGVCWTHWIHHEASHEVSEAKHEVHNESTQASNETSH